MSIRMSAFDEDPGIRPSFRGFVAYAASWEPIPDDGLERYDGAEAAAGPGRGQPRSAAVVGRMSISFTSTCSGWESANMTARAMSSSSRTPLPGLVVEEGRVDHPRLDQRDADARVVVHLAKLLAERLAHRGHRPLRRRVERARKRAPARDRAGDHEVARLLFEEVGEGGADRVGDAQDVGEDHRLPVLGRLLQEAARGAEARRWRTRRRSRRRRRSPPSTRFSQSSHSVTSQRTAIALSWPAELGRERLELVLRSGGRGRAGSRPRLRGGRFSHRCRSRRR